VVSGGGAALLGIDLGTSNTVAALADGDGVVRPVLFDGAELLPSAVFLDADATFLTGRDALHAARAAPHRFEPHPKRCIDDQSVLLGDVEVPIVDLLAAPLRRVASEAGWVAESADRSVTVTCPAGWVRGPRHPRSTRRRWPGH
jgi:molecular chaperone DnaK (HSP70)